VNGLEPNETAGRGHDRPRIRQGEHNDQDLSIQEAALKAAGCQVICAEKRSGTTTEGREALPTVLECGLAGRF
jgi:hypothetical protein